MLMPLICPPFPRDMPTLRLPTFIVPLNPRCFQRFSGIEELRVLTKRLSRSITCFIFLGRNRRKVYNESTTCKAGARAVSIISSGATDIGQKRKTNQDAICLYPKRHFYAVADGMGGHNGGDIASQMSAKLLPEFVEKNSDKMSAKELLADSIKQVNRRIYDHGKEREELKGMGTTVCGLIFDGPTVNIANVGDSRAYLVSKGKIYQMTRDHSLVQEKLNMGLYDREGARRDPQKNVLIRTVGFEEDVEVDVYHYKVSRNDIFLLCSDGLHGKVSDEDIVFIVNNLIPDPALAGQKQLDATVKELIDQANANGGQDNISVVMALAK